jgi:hypothetical protein
MHVVMTNEGAMIQGIQRHLYGKGHTMLSRLCAIVLLCILPLTPLLGQTPVDRPVPLLPVSLFDIQTFKESFGYIDTTGNIAIPPQFQWGDYFYEGLAAVKIGGKWGFIDGSGKTIVKPAYDRAWHFSEGYAPVQVGKSFGYIDRTGTLVVPARFDDCGYFKEGMAWFQLDGKIGYIDKAGTPVISPTYSKGKDFSEGLAAVSVGTRWGFIDKKGTMVIPAAYDGGYAPNQVSDFENGMSVAQMPGLPRVWVLIDRKGNTVADLGEDSRRYVECTNFRNGVATLGGKETFDGLLTKDGTLTQPKFDIPNATTGFDVSWATQIREFQDGLAAVEINGKWGYIYPNGEIALAPVYESVGQFGEAFKGIAHVRQNGKLGYRSLSKVIFDGNAQWDSKASRLVRN